MGNLKGLPEVLKAVTDPFSLLALMVVVLGAVAYSAVRLTRQAKAGSIPAPLIALSIVAVSFLAFMFNVVRVGQLQSNTKPQTVPTQLSLQAIFTGVVQHKVPVTVPFSISSGQINVGCGESASSQVSWNLPVGAREVNSSPSWQNADGLKSTSQNAVVQGTSVLATGQISGQDRQWTGNCPGGGHGELLLKGTYVIDQASSGESISFPAFQGTVIPGSTTAVDIPTAEGLSSLTCKITVTNLQGKQSTAVLSIETAGSDQKAVRVANQTGEVRVTARLEGKALLVQI